MRSVTPDTVTEVYTHIIEKTDCISRVLPISSERTLDNDKCVNVTARTAQYPWNTYEEHLTELPRRCSCNLTLTNLVLWSCLLDHCVIHIFPENFKSKGKETSFPQL